MDFPPLILDRLQDSFDPMDKADVQALERDLGVSFPPEYVEFLLKYNGAAMQHPVGFRVRTPGPFVEGGSLDHSLGVIKEWPFSESAHNVRWHADCYRGRIPEGLVPIAVGSDPICIALSRNDYGKVYLWDSIDEGEDDNIYLIADSFEEFLQCLYAEDESYTYVERLPVFQAVERGELKAVHEFLADGGKVDCRNEQAETLLMCAARTGWPKIVELLLNRGADPNSRDADECTPVYHAAMGQSNDGLKLLFAAGADPRYCDDRGRTLVQLSEERAYHRIARTVEKQLAML